MLVDRTYVSFTGRPARATTYATADSARWQTAAPLGAPGHKFFGHCPQIAFSYGGHTVASVRRNLCAGPAPLSFPYNMKVRRFGTATVAAQRHSNRQEWRPKRQTRA